MIRYVARAQRSPLVAVTPTRTDGNAKGGEILVPGVPLTELHQDGIGRAYEPAAVTHLPEVIDLRVVDDPEIEIDLRRYVPEQAGLLAASRSSRMTKRAIDIVGSLVGLILLSPLLILTTLAISLTSRGSPIYKQTRVGRDARTFTLYKFRSMRVSADRELHLLQESNETTGPVFKIRDDPRVTTVGRFIRRASIDELPQLWNVLRGHMSLVGPRPPLPEEVEHYTAWERQRLTVSPGLTCIWQVSGRSDIDFETWISMDLEYIEQWRPWLDIVLIAKTIPAVLLSRGAY